MVRNPEVHEEGVPLDMVSEAAMLTRLFFVRVDLLEREMLGDVIRKGAAEAMRAKRAIGAIEGRMLVASLGHFEVLL